MTETTAQRDFTGLRVLLVEDNFLIAAYLSRLLTSWGISVIGPAPSVDEGTRLAQGEQLSGAILDVNIVGGNSVPIAQQLQERGTPFFFITGYGSPQALPDSMRKRPRLNKPIDEAALHKTVSAEFLLN